MLIPISLELLFASWVTFYNAVCPNASFSFFFSPDLSSGYERAPVRACYRYLINRPGQFNYQDAMTMLALRVLRANGDWDSYWLQTQVAIA